MRLEDGRVAERRCTGANAYTAYNGRRIYPEGRVVAGRSRMTLNQLLLLLAAVGAGMVNSVAGGGTLLTFPSLFSILKAAPSALTLAKGAGVIANGTSTVALLPGSAVAAWEYREHHGKAGRWFTWLLIPSIVGGLAGAILVTALPPGVFDRLVPWLILTAAILFALQPRVSKWMVTAAPHERPSAGRLTVIFTFQFLVALYGGYFGAGIGILMLSALALMGLSDIHIMNGVKNFLATTINAMAALVFIVAGDVDYRLALPMMVAAIIGGFLGARLAQRMNRVIVRRVVVAIGFSLAAYYFYRQFAAGE